MKAGRELDALVAEKVMGWKRMRWIDFHSVERGFRGEDLRKSLTYSWHNADGCMTENAKDMDDYYNPSYAWSPFTDIAAAWEVVEKLVEMGYTFELYSPGALINDEFGMHSAGWGVNFYTWSEPYLPGGRVGATKCHTMDEKSGGTVV